MVRLVTLPMTDFPALIKIGIAIPLIIMTFSLATARGGSVIFPSSEGNRAENLRR